MRFGIIGAGGVGGYFGAMLARAGFDVCFLARGAHLEALKRNGLRIESREPGGFTARHAVFTSDPAEAGPCETLFFCVKTTSNEDIIPTLHPMMGPPSTIITLQNGVDNGERLAREFGWNRVMEGVAYIFSHLARPGVVEQTGGPRQIVFGNVDGRESSRARAILQALRNAEIPARLSTEIRSDIWRKFIFICAVSGMTALTRASIGEIMHYPETARLMREIMSEVYCVSAALGIPLPAGTDQACFELLGKQNPDSRSSLFQDLIEGKRLEIDSLCGFVSHAGKKYGVPTPLNDYIYATLKLADLRACEHSNPREAACV